MPRCAVTVLLLAAASGCSESEYFCDGPAEIVDTVGTVFTWDREDCAAGRHADTPPPIYDCDDEEASIISIWGRFYSVAITCGSGWTELAVRPIACTSDDDCMAFDRGGESSFVFECRVGLCQNVDTEEYPEDWVPWMYASALCNAPLPRGVPYSGPDYCPGGDFSSEDPCPLPLPDVCMQPM
jgi:hypothetical protein